MSATCLKDDADVRTMPIFSAQAKVFEDQWNIQGRIRASIPSSRTKISTFGMPANSALTCSVNI